MKKSELNKIRKIINENFADNITSTLSDNHFFGLLDKELMDSVVTIIEENVDDLIGRKIIDADRDEASRLTNDILKNYLKYLSKKAKRTRFFGKFKFKNLIKK